MFSFNDGFEPYTQPIEMFAPHLWTDSHATYPGNIFTPSSAQAYAGNQSLYCLAVGSPDGIASSKTSVIRNDVSMPEGSIARFSARFFIPSGQALNKATLMDKEARTSWDPGNSLPNQSPGLRLQFTSVPGVLKIDRGKIGYAEHFLPEPGKEIPVPRDTWFKLTWETKIGLGENGYSKLWIDDVLMIDGVGDTVADPVFYATFGIVLTGVFMDSFEIGVSSNQLLTEIDLYTDDVVFTVTIPGTPPDFLGRPTGPDPRMPGVKNEPRNTGRGNPRTRRRNTARTPGRYSTLRGNRSN